MQGCITDIQRFSLNDGPGIRTTVFTKGCNMLCRWCHNPETLKANPELQFFESKCIGCQGCKPNAETDLADASDLLVDAQGHLRHYRNNCHANALVKVGRMVTPEDVLAEVLQDKNFYASSGGGVTFSGGELTVQTQFSFETLSLLHDRGIHTAIETNLASPWACYEKLLPVLDLIMFDIKSIDSAKHQEWTGIGNALILENAEKLGRESVSVIVRTPVIPGFNDTAEDIEAIAKYVRSYPHLEYYELLAFNPLGADKYKCMGKPYLMEDAKMIPEETMKQLKAVAESVGIEVRIA